MNKILATILLISFTFSNLLYSYEESSSGTNQQIQLSSIIRDAIVYGASDQKLLQMAKYIDTYLSDNIVDLGEQHKLRVIQDKIINYFLVKRSFARSSTTSTGSQRLVTHSLRTAFIDDDAPELRLRKELPNISIDEFLAPTFLIETKAYGSNPKKTGTPLIASLKGVGSPNLWEQFWQLFRKGTKPELDNIVVNRVASLYDYQARLWLKSAKNSLKTLLFYSTIYPASVYYNNSTTAISRRICSIENDEKSLCTSDVLYELNRTAIEYKYNELRSLKSLTPQTVADDICMQIRQVVLSDPLYEEMGCYPQWFRTLGPVNDNGITLTDTRHRTSVKPASDLSQYGPDLNIGSDRLENVSAYYEQQVRNKICASFSSALSPVKASGTGTLLLTDSLQGLKCDIYSEKNKEILSEQEILQINDSNIRMVKSAINESVNMILTHVDETNEKFKDSFINSQKGKPYKEDDDLYDYVVENIKDLMKLNPVAAAQALVSHPGYIPLLAAPLFEQLDSDQRAEEITDSIVRAGTYLVGGACAVLAIVAPYAGVPVLAAYASVLGATSTVLFVAGTTYTGIRSYGEYNTYLDVQNVIQSQNGDNLSVLEMQTAYERAIDLAYETAINGTLISISAALSLLSKSASIAKVSTNELGTIDDVIAFEKQGSKTPLSTFRNKPKNDGGYYQHPSMKNQGIPIAPVEYIDDFGGGPFSSGTATVLAPTQTIVKPVPKTSNGVTQAQLNSLMPSSVNIDAVQNVSNLSTPAYSYVPYLNSLQIASSISPAPGQGYEYYTQESMKIYIDGEAYVQNASGNYININDLKISKTEYTFINGKMIEIKLSPKEKLELIKQGTLEESIQISRRELGGMTVEEINRIATPIEDALMGMTQGSVKELVINGKAYILKNLGGNSAALGSVMSEIRNANWYYYHELGPKTLLLKYKKKRSLFLSDRILYELLIEKVDGINVKDIILDPFEISRWRENRVEVMKKKIEEVLEQEFETIYDAHIAFAKAVLADKALMEKIEKARELLKSSFASTDDVQFMLQPTTKTKKAQFNFIDGGRNSFLKNYGEEYNPGAAYELDYLMDVLERISKANPQEPMPWIVPPDADPFRHPMQIK